MLFSFPLFSQPLFPLPYLSWLVILFRRSQPNALLSFFATRSHDEDRQDAFHLISNPSVIVMRECLSLIVRCSLLGIVSPFGVNLLLPSISFFRALAEYLKVYRLPLGRREQQLEGHSIQLEGQLKAQHVLNRMGVLSSA